MAADEFEQHNSACRFASRVDGVPALPTFFTDDRISVLIVALTTQAKAAEPPLWVLIGLDGHMGPTITYRDTARDAIFTLTKGFQPSRPQQLARQLCAARLRNTQVSHMQKGTTAVF